MSEEFLVSSKQVDIKLLYTPFLDEDGEAFFSKNFSKISERRKLQSITTNADFVGAVRNPEARFWYMYTMTAVDPTRALGPPVVFDNKTMTTFFNVERAICGLFVEEAERDYFARIWPQLGNISETFFRPELDSKMTSARIQFKDPSRVKFIFGSLFDKAWSILDQLTYYRDYTVFVEKVRTETSARALLTEKNESSGLVASTFIADELHAGTIKAILVGLVRTRGTSYVHAACMLLIKQIYARLCAFSEKTGVLYVRLSVVLAYTLTFVSTIDILRSRYPVGKYKYHIKHEPADATRDSVLIPSGKDDYKMCVYNSAKELVDWWQIYPHTTSDELGAFCSLSAKEENQLKSFTGTPTEAEPQYAPYINIKQQPSNTNIYQNIKIKQEPGISTNHQQQQVVTVKQEPNIVTVKQEPNVVTVKQEPGIHRPIKIKQEPGVHVKQEPSSKYRKVKLEPGIPIIKQERPETIYPIETSPVNDLAVEIELIRQKIKQERQELDELEKQGGNNTAYPRVKKIKRD